VPDPAAIAGPDVERRHAFRAAFRMLDTRIGLFVALPIDKLDRFTIRRNVDEIGRAAAPARQEL